MEATVYLRFFLVLILVLGLIVGFGGVLRRTPSGAPARCWM